MNKTLIVMGNGPSLKDLDWDLFKGVDTFGLNAAYRVYEKMNWYPTYHGCFDYIVTDCHRQNFTSLINTGRIKNHFYIRNISNASNFTHINLKPWKTTHKINKSPDDFSSFRDNGNSGTNACSVGMCLGYKNIILVGVDCNYVEHVDGSAHDGQGGLKMFKTPETNPNYWFDDYQQEGDRYNVPRGEVFHKPAWNEFSQLAKDNGINVVNSSPISTLECFDKVSLEQAVAQYVKT